MSQLIRWPHWRYVLTLTFALAAPAAGDNAACEGALAEYYIGHDTPHDVADAYAASKAAFDHTIREVNKASMAALRFFHEMGSTSEAILGVSRAINDATAAASEAADKAELARALWSSLKAGTSQHPALEALNIEHAAFMAAVHFHRAGKESLGAFVNAVAYAASRADDGKALDILTAVMDADNVASIYEALTDLEDIGIAGIDQFIGAVRAFHDAGEEAGLSAKKAATTLEIMASAAACG